MTHKVIVPVRFHSKHISQVTVVGIHLIGIYVCGVWYAFYVPIHRVPPQLVIFQKEFALPIPVKGQFNIFLGPFLPMTVNSIYPSSKVNPTQSS